MNILVTDPDYKHSLGIVRNLSKRDIKPYLLSFKKGSLCSYSKFSNQEILINKDYTLDQLIEVLLNYKIELIILVGTNSFKKIVQWKAELKKNNVNIVTVNEDIQNIAFSKKETYSLAKDLGVPIPKTFYPTNFDDIDTLKDNISFPCVIKGLYEVGGNIVDYAYFKNELKEKYLNICDKYNINEKSGLPMLQEYITGPGCAFFAAYNDGKCVATFQHKRIREFPVSGGASVCAESYINDKLELYGRKLLDALHWNGVAMVEFKLNASEEPILMEINPKFWGSTDLALEAGIDFPLILVDIHLGKEIKYEKNFKFPFRYHWPLQGDFMHAFYNKKAFFQIIIDTLNPKVKSNIWLHDFGPNTKMLIDFLKSIIIKIVRK